MPGTEIPGGERQRPVAGAPVRDGERQPCDCLSVEDAAAARLSRRRALKTALALGAAGVAWSAPRIERFELVPDYAEAATNPCAAGPGLVRMLGWTDKSTEDLSNSEFRADFIIRVPATATIGTITYRQYTTTAAGSNLTAAQVANTVVNNVDQHYRIIARTTTGGCDLIAISLMGDAGHNNANERRADYISIPYGAVTSPPSAAGTIVIGQSLTTTTNVALAGALNGFDTQIYLTSPTTSTALSPIVRLPWDYAWGGYPSGMSSQTGWGRLVPAGGDSGAVFTIHPRNAATTTCNAPSTGTGAATSATVKYQWAKETTPGVFSLVGFVQTYTGDNGDTLSWNGTTGPSFLRLSQDFSASGFGPGYYKLLCWPEMQARLTESCVGRYTPYDSVNPNSVANISSGWTVGSAFYSYTPTA